MFEDEAEDGTFTVALAFEPAEDVLVGSDAFGAGIDPPFPFCGRYAIELFGLNSAMLISGRGAAAGTVSVERNTALAFCSLEPRS